MEHATGVIPLWKPRGMTSFGAVKEVKKIFETKKAGHTGTLDPDVDGVLPICLGRATKLVEYLTADRKMYEGEVTLGFSTTTEDQSGDLVEQKQVDRPITSEEVEAVFGELTGEITQTPPMFSAVKVKGKRLYEYAREGITVERPQRNVTIYNLTLLSPVTITEDGLCRFSFRTECSKGTYIRTLSVTIGEKLGFPAHMSLLTRTASGVFQGKDCFTLPELIELKNDNKLKQSLISIETALSTYPKILVDSEIEKKVLNGAILPASIANGNVDETLVALYNQQEECLALYEKHPNRIGMLKPAKMLRSADFS
ncbi:tRNA pseudouridine(55) synthase TruB [Evansella sp. AB-P1]|uniref:tRNA pseudouridine(55) synthase TruB n=1 Tax=Evansella sp. AB-P1 TaxID=3037653 RepID=UPI00241D1148|nr:tRNA pseudouridine(55) synthase TruB [Evansella sp. AB-P1]MDG5788995.1 tRNA pseudouridine(55) synthase TruB [Evansella sp. AB-P1]